MQRRNVIPALAATAAAIAAGPAIAREDRASATPRAEEASAFGDPSALFPENAAMRRILSRLAEAAAGKAAALSSRERKIAVLAAWAGTGCAEALEEKMGDLVGEDFKAEEVRELLYQSTAYLGAGRTARLFAAMSRGFQSAGIVCPDETKALEGDRRTEGNRLQVEGYGPRLERIWELLRGLLCKKVSGSHLAGARGLHVPPARGFRHGARAGEEPCGGKPALRHPAREAARLALGHGALDRVSLDPQRHGGDR